MIWEGVYSNIKEIPVYDFLDTEAWVQSQVKKLRSTIVNPNKIKEENLQLKSLLDSSRNVKVVDYGGSLALSYVALGCPRNVEYHVVETSAICCAASELDLEELANVKFHDHPDGIDFKYDILYTRTALQYAADWKKDLTLLLKGNPTIVSLAHTSCGDIPTYLTTQKWYETRVPYWFINQQELCDFMKSHGYSLILDELCQKIEDMFFDDEGNHSIPWSHILNHTKNLVFTA